jgi:glycerol-3-phosphate dehydrogenase
MLERVRAGETWDVIIIGGGATGLGTLLDAVTRGYRTLLVEAHDYAKGTSSRSTKLVHGGVRYLAQARIGLVREALHERGLLRRNAPHLVHDLAFVVPAYHWWTRPYYGIGLKLYDLLAGDLGFGASRIIGRTEALERLPTLRTDGLRGGVVYFDGQFDDARMAISLLRTATEQGGVALNYFPVNAIAKRDGRVCGIHASDAETGETFSISGRVVINATGVFADSVRRLDEPSAPAMIAPSQGIHLVLDRTFLPGTSAMLIPSTDDGRVLFAIPWHDKVLLGTTDTPVEAAAVDPVPRSAEVDYLLGHARRFLARAPRREDVRSQFAGLRPLIRAKRRTVTSRLSREHSLVVSDSGLVTITGGKWTTYRRMAEETVDRAAEVAALPRRASSTPSWRLHGWTDVDRNDGGSVYGADLSALEVLCNSRPEWRQPLHPNLNHRAGEVIWAARYEAARTVEDVLARRTRALFLDARASVEAAPLTARLLAEELGRDAAWCERQVAAFVGLSRFYLVDS